MKIAKISKKLIKPHTPTPPNLKNYKISFLDKFTGPFNFAVVLFYESKPENNSKLEESLAKILVRFYPLAGRYIKNDEAVDCGDQGVEFVEAEALDVELIDLVAKIEIEQLNSLLPDQYSRLDEAAGDPIMSIQATRFPSGGLAIAISISHRVIDVSSLGTFVAAWSNVNSATNTELDSFTTLPFDFPLLLPNRDYDFGISVGDFSTVDHNFVVKRLLFNKEALTTLRSKISPNCNRETISRVRVVSAVIAKALIGLDRAKLGGVSRDFVLIQPINMRERTIVPQPKHSCGNLSMLSLTRRVVASVAKEIGLPELVDLIGDSIGKSIANYAEIVSPDKDGCVIIANCYKNFINELWDPEMNAIYFTDWSKFGFYEADFGWGKPVRTSVGPRWAIDRTTVLMSDKEGNGIEAWVHLKQDDMLYFEQDEEYIMICFIYKSDYLFAL